MWYANGPENVGIGFEALKQSTGSQNTSIGHVAGDNVTSGSGNIAIGAIARVPSATADRQLVIASTVGSDTTTWLSGDSSGNLTTVGDVTLANNKKVIFGDAGENIVGDGTNLTISSSGTTKIDSVGNIILDADSGWHCDNC